MQPYTKCLVVEKMLQELKRSSAGASLLWAIAALVVVGGLGAAVAVMSPSTVQSKLEQEAAMRAYYNANSGLNFIYSIEHTSEAGGVPYANFLNAVNSGNVVTYPLADGGEFSFQINSLNTNGNNGNYAIDSLVGTVDDANGGKRYSYVIYGGGKGSSTTKPYVPVKTQSGASKYVLFSGESKLSIQGAAAIQGNIYGKSISTSQAVVKGNVISQGDANLGFSTKVTGRLCSMGNVTLNQSEVTEDINAGGDVDLQFASKVGGNVYSGGKVTMATSVQVEGSIHAQSIVSSEFSDTVGNSVYANGKVGIGNSSTVSCNVYCGDTIDLDWNGKIVGVAIGRAVNVGSGSVGSKIITTNYPPNIKPTAPTICPLEKSPTPKPDDQILVNSNNINLAWADDRYNRTNPLAPGSYGTVNLSGSNPLTLRAGIYYFRSIYLGWGSTLNLDLSGGDITIFCLGTFYEDTTSEIMISSNGGSWKSMTSVDKDLAKKVYLEAHDAITLRYGAGWFGTLFSTKSIVFNGAVTIIGAYATSGINQVDWSANVVYVPSNYAIANW
uniref:Integral membrane protein CcmA involved in cell shape determination n=1 Tax=Desulfovibrio sp. U5L TaxID=596152 RepID=I2Q4Q3_9BACT